VCLRVSVQLCSCSSKVVCYSYVSGGANTVLVITFCSRVLFKAGDRPGAAAEKIG
jgi:hypothetical protein